MGMHHLQSMAEHTHLLYSFRTPGGSLFQDVSPRQHSRDVSSIRGDPLSESILGVMVQISKENNIFWMS
jgi:hypothetical protein